MNAPIRHAYKLYYIKFEIDLSHLFQTFVGSIEKKLNSLMVPIVIGLLLGIVVLYLSVVLVFIVKKKQSQHKYDQESSQNNEESKQLKESNPEA